MRDIAGGLPARTAIQQRRPGSASREACMDQLHTVGAPLLGMELCQQRIPEPGNT